ncbi:unnamed protein product [Hymenolepis diminuta]|uniref:Homeobox domain-containing protein n=2 Tax=Hymenolepis diminuta TaxID=6216 RepID=A0A3P6YEV0_HYMDI|nr:unnamed protein product [Hymenolepis diminuta]
MQGECCLFIIRVKIMPGGSDSFFIENLLKKCDSTKERTGMEITTLKSVNDVVCNPHGPPSDKKSTKDNSSTNSGSTNLSPPQPGSYRSESSVESPTLKFSPESLIMPSLDIKRNYEYPFFLDDTVQSQSQFTFPWLHLPQVSSGLYQGRFNTSPSTYFPSPPTPKEDERGEIIEYSSEDFGSAPTQENRPKRARITFSSYQVKVLRAIYYQKKYLSNAERCELAGMLGVSEQQLKIWFQNQRYKEKKSLDREKENAYSPTNIVPSVRIQPSLLPLSPLPSSHSGFVNNQRKILPFRFPYPVPLIPPPQLLSQMNSKSYRHLAQIAGMMSSQLYSVNPLQSTFAKP